MCEIVPVVQDRLEKARIIVIYLESWDGVEAATSGSHEGKLSRIRYRIAAEESREQRNNQA